MTATSFRRWARAPWFRSPAFWIIVALNLALLGLYIWTRGGGTTDLRITVNGSDYRAYVDGRLVVVRNVPGHDTGGIGFRIQHPNDIPSLPSPSGVDSVRVTDYKSGAVLLADDFDGPLDADWTVASGDWKTDSGALVQDAHDGTIIAGSTAWTDYIVEAKLRNVQGIDVYARIGNVGNYFDLNLEIFQDYKATLTVLEGQRQTPLPGANIQLSRTETIRSMVATLLRSYPTALLIIIGAIVLAFVARLAWLERHLAATGRSIILSTGPIVLILAVFALALLWYINFFVLDHMPHVPDSVLYIFQSKIFASFRLTAPAPPVREAFSIFTPHMDQVVGGRWFSHYPFGHPMFLAIGQTLHAVWLVPPVLGAACVYLLYRVGNQVYGAAVGLLAAVLLLFSPFFQMSASEFMSHNTAAFEILMCLALLAWNTKRRAPAMFASGIFLGLLFNTRPLTAVSFMPVLAALMAYELLRARPRRLQLLREDLAFSAGALLMLFAYFLYNKATTGSFTESAYALQGTYSSETFGFGGTHTVALGLQNQKQLLSLMLLVANGWPVFIGLAFAALPFLLGTRHRWDYFLAASAISIAGANILYRNPAIMYGPRFWYESMPFLMLLSARGAIYLRDAAVDAAHWLDGRLRRGPPASSPAITGAAIIGLMLGLVAFSSYGWMLDQRAGWSGLTTMPTAIASLDGFNYANNRLLDEADKMHLEHALVLVHHCTNWWCFGSEFWTNSPNLDGNIVWADQQNNSDDLAVADSFPGRSLYVADYGSGTIEPVTRAEVIRQSQKQAPTPGTPPLRDNTRQKDLGDINDALDRYRADHGTYPNSDGRVQSLCLYKNLDAGCALLDYITTVPQDPLTGSVYHGYWYLSDGTHFTLIAEQETQGIVQRRCPQEIVFVVPTAGYCVNDDTS